MNQTRPLAADDLRIQRVAAKVYFHRQAQPFADRVTLDWIDVEGNPVAALINGWMTANSPLLISHMAKDSCERSTIIFTDESGGILLSIRRLMLDTHQLTLPL